jgi:hypothetical protein
MAALKHNLLKKQQLKKILNLKKIKKKKEQ